MPATDLFVPTATQAITALLGWLEKATAFAAGRGEDPDALLSLRLAPDMYPLSAQIRFVAFQSQEAVHRLLGQPVPDALFQVRKEGWDAGERPGTLAHARNLLGEAGNFLATVNVESLRGGIDRDIALELPNGIIFDMKGGEFVRDWALPQLYFHLVAAYAILRHHGVPLGKADFVPHMFAYIRPGTMPQG